MKLAKKIDYIENQDEEGNSLKDAPRERHLKLWGNIVKFRCSDPYGFWKISLDKGNLPPKLKGEYTTYDEAVKAAKNYYENEKGKILRTPETV